MPRVIEEGLARIREEVRGIHVVVGHPEYAAEGVYNAASVFRDGELVVRARKQLLPNYGVFDERRHFLPWRGGTATFELGGRCVGLCICEDVWGPHPAASAKAAGAELLLNINASPYDISKHAGRREVLRARAAETGLPIFYVNMVGGQDDLIFDGDSQAVNADGSEAFRAPVFEDGLHLVTYSDGRWHGAAAAGLSQEATVYRGLVQATRDYVNRNGFPGALIGLSGGIDSALIAAIAADALGPARVWGVSMPSRYTADMSNDDARIEAEALGIRYSMLPIEAAYEAITGTLAEAFAGKPVDLAEENIQSRSRGILLMALSNKFGPVVLTTGNKSEMAVGYSTLYGDLAGGFAVIKDIYKTFVYRLCAWRNSVKPDIPQNILTRAPSAELRPDQTDQDSLPPYETLDAIIQAYMERDESPRDIVASGHDQAAVHRVVTLLKRNEYKRRQAPPGVRVTERGFGKDWRYPITNRYADPF